MKEKVLFLDIDGVLCTARSRAAYGKITGLDPVCCHILLRLAREFDLDIVLHSTWRLYLDGFKLFKEELSSKCPELLDYIKDVCDVEIVKKSFAIQDYIEKNDVVDYTIVDDEAVTDDPRLHCTKEEDGFSFFDYKILRKMYKGKDE